MDLSIPLGSTRILCFWDHWRFTNSRTITGSARLKSITCCLSITIWFRLSLALHHLKIARFEPTWTIGSYRRSFRWSIRRSIRRTTIAMTYSEVISFLIQSLPFIQGCSLYPFELHLHSWASWIRTSVCSSQSAVPYRLAIAQFSPGQLPTQDFNVF